MKWLIGVIIVILVITGLIIYSVSVKTPASPSNTTNPNQPPVETPPARSVPLRLVYPGNTLITTHLGEVLNHTNILEKNHLIGEFQRAESDTQAVSSLITQRFDAAFLSDISCMLALAQDFNGLVIANLGALGRNTLLFPANSPIKEIKDLKGASVGVTFGTSAHYHLLNFLQKEGLVINKTVNLINLTPSELHPAVLQGTIKALAVTDPAAEQLLRDSKFENKADTLSYGVVLISREWYQKYPEAAASFIRSIKEAFYFTASHKDEVDQWFSVLSKIPADLSRTCANMNLNYNSRGKISNIRIGLTDKFQTILDSYARFNYENGLASKLVQITPYLDPKLIEESKKEIDSVTYDPKQVKVIK
jgi:ABC-type nitrate/sulfonate/bicarbonate transport system substrate-binding protein